MEKHLLNRRTTDALPQAASPSRPPRRTSELPRCASRPPRRARRVALLLSLGVFTLLATGCAPVAGHFSILRGNYYYSRGEYQSAIVDYLTHLEDEEMEPYVSYNLGNVYQALGEGSAALRMWSGAEEAEEEELRYRVLFNRGVFHFERGEYEEAFEEFKEALRVNNARVEAKINLELTLLRLNAEEQLSPRGGGEGDSGGEEVGREALRVLEFVRRKEQQRWEANSTGETRAYQRDW